MESDSYLQASYSRYSEHQEESLVGDSEFIKDYNSSQDSSQHLEDEFSHISPPRVKENRKSKTYSEEMMIRAGGRSLEDPVQEQMKKDAVPNDLEIDYSSEIKKYKLENEKLVKNRKKLQDILRKLDEEAQKMQVSREKELKEIRHWKEGEKSRILKEKANFQRNTKASINRKESEEVEFLRSKVACLQDKAREQEIQDRKTIDSLKQKLQDLTKQKPEEKEPPEIKQKKEERPKPAVKPKTEDLPKQKKPENGKKEINLSNGVRKEVYPDGTIKVHFTNGDIKETSPDGKIVYFFAETNTTQITFPDGLQVFQFANGQVEKHYPDDTKEISFPDGTVKCIFPDGEEESIFPDGTVQKVDANGVKYIDFVNGQKDTIYTDGTKTREFPDGRIRKIMPDGRVFEL